MILNCSTIQALLKGYNRMLPQRGSPCFTALFNTALPGGLVRKRV